tara:strand:- start:1216 stop:1377 length:162 start_codon:yes stop_codon:yes gene_type:complete
LVHYFSHVWRQVHLFKFLENFFEAVPLGRVKFHGLKPSPFGVESLGRDPDTGK